MTDTEKALAIYQTKLDNLIEQYGTGVRPSWVSAEQSRLMQKIDDCKMELGASQ